jgi:proline-specific peptidase
VDNPPLVIVHGGPSIPSDYLFPLADNMQTNRTLIFFDQIGCGKSSIPTDINVYSIENSVNDLQDVITKLNLRRFHLYGHSYGGIVAYEYLKRISNQAYHDHQLDDATNSPNQCLSLILSSAPVNVAMVEAESKLFLEEITRNLQASNVTSTTEEQDQTNTIQTMAADVFRKTHVCRTESLPNPLLTAYAKRGTVWEGTKVIHNYVASPILPDGKANRPSPSLPTNILLMRGEYDFVSEEYSFKGWKKALNHAGHHTYNDVKCITLSGCSHHGLLENGALYGKTLDSFLEVNDCLEKTCPQ